MSEWTPADVAAGDQYMAWLRDQLILMAMLRDLRPARVITFDP